jgi:hypothetical protein
MNAAYKHLDTKLKIAELTLGQWFGVVLGIGIAFMWGFYISPLGTYITIATAVYLGAVPAGFALMSTVFEVNLGVVLRSAVSWVRLDGRFAPGPGPGAEGYVVRADPVDEHDQRAALANLDPAALWET